MVSIQQRLTLEVEDIVINFISVLKEIISLRSSTLEPILSTTNPLSEQEDNLTDMMKSTIDAIASSPVTKHRVVKRLPSDEVSFHLSS